MFSVLRNPMNGLTSKQIRLYNVVKHKMAAASSASFGSSPSNNPAHESFLIPFRSYSKVNLMGQASAIKQQLPKELESFVISYRPYSKVNLMGQTSTPKQLTKKECEERVMKAIKAWDRFPHDRLDKLHINARFQEDLSFDSLDHVEIIMALEDEFHMEVPDTDAEKLKTPNDMVKYICEKEDVFE